MFRSIVQRAFEAIILMDQLAVDTVGYCHLIRFGVNGRILARLWSPWKGSVRLLSSWQSHLLGTQSDCDAHGYNAERLVAKPNVMNGATHFSALFAYSS